MHPRRHTGPPRLLVQRGSLLVQRGSLLSCLLVQSGSLLSCLLLRASAATAWCEGVGEGLSCLPKNVTTLEEV